MQFCPSALVFNQALPSFALLAPSLDGVSFIIEHIKAAAKESNLIIEALIFLPNSSVEGPSSISAQLDSLGLIFNQFSSIQGIQYWSASRKIMRTLYVESYRIDNLKSRNRISDPSTASELKNLCISTRKIRHSTH